MVDHGYLTVGSCCPVYGTLAESDTMGIDIEQNIRTQYQSLQNCWQKVRYNHESMTAMEKFSNSIGVLKNGPETDRDRQNDRARKRRGRTRLEEAALGDLVLHLSL